MYFRNAGWTWHRLTARAKTITAKFNHRLRPSARRKEMPFVWWSKEIIGEDYRIGNNDAFFMPYRCTLVRFILIWVIFVAKFSLFASRKSLDIKKIFKANIERRVGIVFWSSRWEVKLILWMSFFFSLKLGISRHLIYEREVAVRMNLDIFTVRFVKRMPNFLYTFCPSS